MESKVGRCQQRNSKRDEKPTNQYNYLENAESWTIGRAEGSFCVEALSSHFFPSLGFRSTPNPSRYISARRIWEAVWPCSAALRHHLKASSGFGGTPRPTAQYSETF